MSKQFGKLALVGVSHQPKCYEKLRLHICLCIFISICVTHHLSNTLITLSDNKIGVDNTNDNLADFYEARVLSATDYYAFGMAMKERSWQSEKYRYGFNGKENDSDWEVQDYGFRIYKPEIAKFLSVDPLTRDYPSWSPYPFAMNRPIDGVDLDGLEWKSENKWSDKVPGLGEFTYADLWSISAKPMLQRYIGKKFDCADLAITVFVEFASIHGLPVHFEGHNTGQQRLYDNDLMQFTTYKDLADAISNDYSASDFFNNSSFVQDKSFSSLEAGDLVLWRWLSNSGLGGHYHTQTVTSIRDNGNYGTIQGSTLEGAPTPASAHYYKIEWIANGGRIHNELSALAETKAKSWNFDYMDKFFIFNTMSARQYTFIEVRDRLAWEYCHQKGILGINDFGGTLYENLPLNIRKNIHQATQHELDTGKPYWGTYDQDDYWWYKE